MSGPSKRPGDGMPFGGGAGGVGGGGASAGGDDASAVGESGDHDGLTGELLHARLVDYLYSELGAEERARFEHHLASCDSCRGELDTLAAVRAQARTVVAAPLSDPLRGPPPELRARILAAAMARRAARPRASTVPTVNPSNAARSPSKKAEVASGELGEQLWGWLRRPWLLPAFTVAGLALVMVVVGQRSKLFEPVRPRDGIERPGERLDGNGEHEPTTKIARPEEESPVGADAPPEEATEAQPSGRSATSGRTGGVAAQSPQPRSQRKKEPRDGWVRDRPSSPALGGLDDGDSAPPAPSKRARVDPRGTPSTDDEAQPQTTPSMPMAPSASSASSPRQDEAERADDAKEASPRWVPGPSAATARSEAPSAASAGGAAPTANAAKPRPAAVRPSTEPGSSKGARVADAATAEPLASPARAEQSFAPTSATAMVSLAEAHYAAQRWAEAAAAYRALLARYPHGHRSAAFWRARLETALRHLADP